MSSIWQSTHGQTSAAISSRQTDFCPDCLKPSACCSCCARYIAGYSFKRGYRFGSPSAHWLLRQPSCLPNASYIGRREIKHNTNATNPRNSFSGGFINKQGSKPHQRNLVRLRLARRQQHGRDIRPRRFDEVDAAADQSGQRALVIRRQAHGEQPRPPAG